MDALMTGLGNLLDPQVLIALLIGSVGGLIIGAVPGIGWWLCHLQRRCRFAVRTKVFLLPHEDDADNDHHHAANVANFRADRANNYTCTYLAAGRRVCS